MDLPTPSSHSFTFSFFTLRAWGHRKESILFTTQPVAETPYRNFNLRPHCMSMGQQALLSRLCEGLPMISRSRGKHFYLFLADQPLPEPTEKDVGPTSNVSVCFWYTLTKQPHSTLSTIVILEPCAHPRRSLFRKNGTDR